MSHALELHPWVRSLLQAIEVREPGERSALPEAVYAQKERELQGLDDGAVLALSLMIVSHELGEKGLHRAAAQFLQLTRAFLAPALRDEAKRQVTSAMSKHRAVNPTPAQGLAPPVAGTTGLRSK